MSSKRQRVASLNPAQQDVYDLVLNGESVFFTACAGTGKSYLLNLLVQQLPSATTFVTASTGIAAVALSGTTLHSWAGIGLGEGSKEELASKAKGSFAKLRWKRCKTLIVDEISMLDAALFDKLEYVARTVREKEQPFGGIQLVLTGDFLQLPPVGRNLQFCFQAESWNACVPRVVELKTVFRQADAALVALLSTVRIGLVEADGFKDCINRAFDTADGIEPTTLYAKRLDVQRENESRLAALQGEPVRYLAKNHGSAMFVDQLRKNCQAVEELVLKVGAQVMCIKNLSFDDALVNGSRGVVVGFDKESGLPVVRFVKGYQCTIHSHTWELKIGAKIEAARQQIPLILAWSLTVHSKSTRRTLGIRVLCLLSFPVCCSECQGMTLDRVSLELGSIFEYGQAYVALSRIKDLNSLCVLDDPFPSHVVKAHPVALRFYQDLGGAQALTTCEARWDWSAAQETAALRA
jgi:ATP-dependent DNA helicase PIF1